MRLLELFQRAQAQVTDAVDAVEPEQWDVAVLPGWTVADLVAHLVAGQLHEPLLLDDDPVPAAMPTGTEELLAGDPLASWEAAADGALTVWALPRDLAAPVPTGGTEVAAGDHLMDLVAQLLVHAWDLGRATGTPPVADADLVSQAAEHAAGRPPAGDAPGVDPTVRAVDVGAEPWTRLLAAYGRRA